MKSAHLVPAHCLLCGAPAPTTPSASVRLAAPYQVVRCPCGFWFLHPRIPEAEMFRIYESGDYFEGAESGYSSYRVQERSLRRTFARLLGNLSSRGAVGGDLLDVGCGYGFFLQEAKGYFDRRFGVDLSPEAVEKARSGADAVWIGGVDAIPEDHRFDLVTALQVIEHVYEPVAFLRGLRSRMRPGARVLLATPDMGGALRHTMGSRWPSFKIPEHVGYYDFGTLRRVLEEAGFSSVTRVPYPHAFPLQVILEKFGLDAPQPLKERPIWIPATTVAALGRLEGVGQPREEPGPG